jgi:hypothetical protein
LNIFYFSKRERKRERKREKKEERGRERVREIKRERDRNREREREREVDVSYLNSNLNIPKRSLDSILRELDRISVAVCKKGSARDMRGWLRLGLVFKIRVRVRVRFGLGLRLEFRIGCSQDIGRFNFQKV